MTCGYIFGHHRPGTDDCPVSNCHAFHYYRSGTDKDPAPDNHWFGVVRRRLAPIPVTDRGMKVVVENHRFRSNIRTFPNLNSRGGTNHRAAQANSRAKQNLSARAHGPQSHRPGATQRITSKRTVQAYAVPKHNA